MRSSLLRASLLASAFCLAYGQTADNPLDFDSASIKPHIDGTGRGRAGGDLGAGAPAPGRDPGGGGLRFMPGRVSSAPIGVTARKIILEAYHLTRYQLAGGPGWLDSDLFDITAKAGDAAAENKLRQMLQTLLAQRFQLVAHRETRELPVYALTVGKNGTKLHEWKEGGPGPVSGSGHTHNFGFRETMEHFTDFLSNVPSVGRPVLDKTGLAGIYDIHIEWDEDDFVPAMQEQLGLKLEAQKGPVSVLTIDSIEKPTSN